VTVVAVLDVPSVAVMVAVPGTPNVTVTLVECVLAGMVTVSGTVAVVGKLLETDTMLSVSRVGVIVRVID
jgi:hypothetical protein